MLSAMLFTGGMVSIIASANRIHTSYTPIAEISLMCYTKLTLTGHKTLELSQNFVFHPLQCKNISSNYEMVLNS